MEAVYYTKQGKEYIVTKCTEDDIVTAYESVRELVTDTDEAEYKQKMVLCVEQGTAWKVLTAGEVVSWLFVRKDVNMWLGAMFHSADIVGMMLGWKELYVRS